MRPSLSTCVALLCVAVLTAAPAHTLAQAAPAPTLDGDDSLRTLRAAVAAARAGADTTALAGALEELGLQHWRADRFDSALVHLLESRERIASRGDSAAVARLSNALGSSHYQLGNYELALQSYVRALTIRTVDGNTLGQSYLHANIAKAYQDWRQHDRALLSADSAVTLGELAGNGHALGYALNTRAGILVNLRRFDEARETATRSLAAYYSGSPATSVRDSLSAWSINVMLLGEVDLAEGRAEDALRRFTEIYARAQRGNTRRGQAHALLRMAQAQEALGRYPAARASLTQAAGHAEAIGNRSFRLEALEGLSRVSERLGATGDALRFARRHEALRDSVFNARAAQRVAAIALEAEVARQRAQALALTRQQAQQAEDLRQQRLLTALIGLLLAVTLAFVLAVLRANRRVRLREVQLAARNRELQEAMAEVRTLSGFIPICANCKNVRDDAGYWRSVEEYMASRSMAQFSHSICNSCGPKLYGDDWEPHTGAATPG